MFLGGMAMTKHTKKDGSTKQQKNKGNSSKKHPVQLTDKTDIIKKMPGMISIPGIFNRLFY